MRNKEAERVFSTAQWSDNVEDPEDIESLLKILIDLSRESDLNIYRGEPGLYEFCNASLARSQDGKQQLSESTLYIAEPHLIAQFRSQVAPHLRPDELELSRTVWGTVVLMQHYRAPTRLLDWSISPWIAAFFATIGNPGEDGYLFAARTDEISRNWDCIPEAVGAPAFNNLVAITDLIAWQEAFGEETWIAALRPSRGTARMVAQQSVFTFGAPMNLDHRATLGVQLGKEAKKLIVIRTELKKEVLTIMAKMNLTSGSLFPGLDGVGQFVGDYFSARIRTPISPAQDWTI